MREENISLETVLLEGIFILKYHKLNQEIECYLSMAKINCERNLCEIYFCD